MPKERMLELFKEYERDVQRVIAEVLAFEQEHISMKQPPFKEPIKKIIDRVVKDEA